MAAEIISFLCPGCRTKLSVPGHLAGVAGPCPLCAAHIVAPDPAAPPPVRPEPRQLPVRQQPIVAKPMPPPRTGSGRTRRSSRLRSFQVWMPIALVGCALAIAAGLIVLLRQHGKAVPSALRLPTAAASVLPPWPELGAAPVRDSGRHAVDRVPGDEVVKALKDFLAASTLEERLPLLETRTPQDELAASCLGGRLPDAVKISPAAAEVQPIEQVTDFFFEVIFDAGEGGKTAQTILVRTRGDGAPKIVADPFLDLFGGRLAEFAKMPSDRHGTFQVLVWPLASCFESDVPQPRKKLTLKLLPDESGRPVALAYCSKQSRIATMLEEGTQPLRYGQVTPCTLTLRWNRVENPAQPFLEAVAVSSPDWNP